MTVKIPYRTHPGGRSLLCVHPGVGQKRRRRRQYFALLQKVEHTEVTLSEVKAGAHMLAERLCNDPGFQHSGGSSVSACLDRLTRMHELCETRVFSQAPATFKAKGPVIELAKAYSSCTGVGD